MTLVAGAGGGAGCDYDRGGATIAEGGAGGSTGEAGNPDSSNSTGGGPGATQSGPGSNGGSLQGGEGGWDTFPGGGGGDGYYGGGGGAGAPGYPPNGGGGGGGSSYAAGGTSISYSNGSGQAVGGSGDANYPGSVGRGGNMVTNGQPGYVVILAYQASAAPTIAGGTRNLNQQESVDYAISASGSPAISSYSASDLPSGLSLNTSTGHITGSVAVPGTYTSTIRATNSIGTSSATLTWVIAAAVIHGYPSVTPGSVFNGGTVQLNSDGTTNFGFGWTENVIWPPSGSPDVLGHFALGAQTNYTPANGTGIYWYQFRVVDIYANYVDEWVSFTVTEVVLPPTTVTVVGTGSYSVSLSWSGASAAAGINHYNVYRNGSLIGTTTGTTYTDSTAAAGTTYSYTIKTVDSASALSAASGAASATTLASLEIFTPLP